MEGQSSGTIYILRFRLLELHFWIWLVYSTYPTPKQRCMDHWMERRFDKVGEVLGTRSETRTS